jgi:hypothetical protein
VNLDKIVSINNNILNDSRLRKVDKLLANDDLVIRSRKTFLELLEITGLATIDLGFMGTMSAENIALEMEKLMNELAGGRILVEISKIDINRELAEVFTADTAVQTSL